MTFTVNFHYFEKPICFCLRPSNSKNLGSLQFEDENLQDFFFLSFGVNLSSQLHTHGFRQIWRDDRVLCSSTHPHWGRILAYVTFTFLSVCDFTNFLWRIFCLYLDIFKKTRENTLQFLSQFTGLEIKKRLKNDSAPMCRPNITQYI